VTSDYLGHRIFPRLYRDSVALMALASSLEKRDGVKKAGAVMATPGNLEIVSRSDMLPEELNAAPDDLLVVARGDRAAVEDALASAEDGLDSRDDSTTGVVEARPKTITQGLERLDATIATVSTPGTYAPIVIEQALRAGLHVMCFSDNVSVADEIRLKQMAVERRRLMMGPDCGTAIIDGAPLGFANVVRRGSVAIVAASGTGAQEVSCLLDRAGVGVSQLIGVGGRDLSEEVDGAMTLFALDLIEEDDETSAVVLVSKPPAKAVADKVLGRLAALKVPAVACMLGAEDTDGDVPVRGTLEAAALTAVDLVGGSLAIDDPTTAVDQTVAPGILGLYTGGTLAGEAKVILKRAGRTPEVLDLGGDEYTAGRPHPMIEPDLRTEHILRAADRDDIGVVLLDIVLGFGSHADPAGVVAQAVNAAREVARTRGRSLRFLGSVTGTEADPQGFAGQVATAIGAGIEIFPCNASAARAAIRLTTREENA
jgi:FdrA protein